MQMASGGAETLNIVIMGLMAVVVIGQLVCFIMVLIKMFQDDEDGGVGKGIFGFFCGLYAFIWGWQFNQKHNLKKVMVFWTLTIVLIAVVYAVMAAFMFKAGMQMR